MKRDTLLIAIAAIAVVGTRHDVTWRSGTRCWTVPGSSILSSDQVLQGVRDRRTVAPSPRARDRPRCVGLLDGAIIRPDADRRITRHLKIVVEEHADGYMAYPVGLQGAVVGQGDTNEAALAGVVSAIRFHIETFGPDAIDAEVIDACLTEVSVEMKLPRDAHRQRVIRALSALEFRIGRAGNHIPMERWNADGSRTPRTLPNHEVIKGSILRVIYTQTGIDSEA